MGAELTMRFALCEIRSSITSLIIYIFRLVYRLKLGSLDILQVILISRLWKVNVQCWSRTVKVIGELSLASGTDSYRESPHSQVSTLSRRANTNRSVHCRQNVFLALSYDVYGCPINPHLRRGQNPAIKIYSWYPAEPDSVLKVNVHIVYSPCNWSTQMYVWIDRLECCTVVN